MATFVTGDNIGDAWLGAYRAIAQSQGSVVNMAVEIRSPLEEDLGVRGAIEEKVAQLRDIAYGDFARAQSIHTVANTIFPISLYRPGPTDAAERFITQALRGEEHRGHAPHTKRRWGTYIGRLLAYPARTGGTTNQLEACLERLRGTKNWADIYEMPIASPGDAADDLAWEEELSGPSVTAGAVLHGDIKADPLRIGGPCLAHLSLTLEAGAVSMLALYRHHVYVARAYGNFLGLARLLNFFARESGYRVGNLMVVTGHAECETRVKDRRELLAAAEDAAGTASLIEVGARSFGMPWQDLDLRRARIAAP